MLLNALQFIPVLLYFFFPVLANLVYLVIGLSLSLLYLISIRHLRPVLLLYFSLSVILLITKTIIASLLDSKFLSDTEKTPWIDWFLCPKYYRESSFDFMSLIPDLSFILIFLLLSETEYYLKPGPATKGLARLSSFITLGMCCGMFFGWLGCVYNFFLLTWLISETYINRKIAKIVQKTLALVLLTHLGLAFIDLELDLSEVRKLFLGISSENPITWVVFTAFVSVSSIVDTDGLRYNSLKEVKKPEGVSPLKKRSDSVRNIIMGHYFTSKKNKYKGNRQTKNNHSVDEGAQVSYLNPSLGDLKDPVLKTSNSESPNLADSDLKKPLLEKKVVENENFKEIKPVLVSHNEEKDEENDAQSLKKSMIFLYILLKINLCLLVEITSNITGLLIIVWFGFILICKDEKKTKWVNRFVLNLGLIAAYIVNLYFHLKIQEESRIIFPMMLAVILSGVLSKNQNYLLDSDEFPESWFFEITIWAFSNTSFLLVIVLFITGLAQINLIHLGLLIFCLMYVINKNLSKVNWSLLIIYLTFILFIRKLWEIVGKHLDYSLSFIRFIGLSSESSSNSINQVYWVILFLYGVLRYLASKPQRQKQRPTTEKIKNLIKKLFDWFKTLEILIIYSGMFYGILKAETNFLNFFRSFLVLVLIVRTLGYPDSSVFDNFKNSRGLIKVLMFYSCSLLCIRYAFQFLIYFNDYSILDKVGLEVYEKTLTIYLVIAIDSLYAFACIRLWVIYKGGILETIDRDRLLENSNNQNLDTENLLKSEAAVTKSIDLKLYNNTTRKFFLKSLFSVLHLIIFMVISWLSVYWKLSFSMGVYLMVVLVYCAHVTLITYKKITELNKILKKNQESIQNLKTEIRESYIPDTKNEIIDEIKNKSSELEKLKELSKDLEQKGNYKGNIYIKSLEADIDFLEAKNKDLDDMIAKKNNSIHTLQNEQFQTEKSYNNKIHELEESEWNLRIILWRRLMSLTLINICIGYLRYFCVMEISEYDPIIETIYFWLGFTKIKESLFYDIYGYLIVFVLLVFLRFAISETKPKVRETEAYEVPFLRQPSSVIGLKKGVPRHMKFFQTAMTTLQKPINDLLIHQKYKKLETKLSKYKMIVYFQEATKQCIYIFVFGIAIQKFNLFSTFEIFLVSVSFCFKYPKREMFIGMTLVISLMAQYAIYIMTLNIEISPEIIPEYIAKISKFDGISLLQEKSSYSQLITSSFLGLTKIQFDMLFWQLFTCMMMMFMWIQLSWSKQNERLCNLILPSPSSIQKRHFIGSEITKPKSFTYTVISLIYKFSRFVLILLALFISVLSKSLFSILYFMCCAYFLYMENLLILYQSTEEDKNLKTGDLSARKTDEKPAKHPFENNRDMEKDDQNSSRPKVPQIDLTKSQGPASIPSLLESFPEKGLESQTDEKLCIEKGLTNKIGYYLFILDLFIFFNFLEIWFRFGYNMFFYYTESNSYSAETKETIIKRISLQAIVLCMATFIKIMLKDPDSRENQINEILRIKQESRKIFKNMTWIFYRLMHKRKKANLAKKVKLEKKMNDLNPVKVAFNESTRRNCQLSSVPVDAEKLNKLHFRNKTFASESNFLSEVLISCVNYSLFDKRMQKFMIPGIDLENKSEISKKHKTLIKNRDEFFTQGKIYPTIDFLNIMGRKRSVQSAQDCFDTDRNSLNAQPNPQADPQSDPPRLVLHTFYRVTWKDIPELLCYALISNMDFVVYSSFVINHMQYGRIESLVLPLTVFTYAILEFPRPPIRYFRGMLLYVFAVILGKLLFQLDILEKNRWVQEFQDPFHIGFRRVKDNEFFYYILWDIVVIFTILCREYYIIRIGAWTRREIDQESYLEVKDWLSKSQEYIPNTKSSSSWRYEVEKWLEGIKKTSFLKRLVPEVSFVKPGTDLYLFTYFMQILIFVFLIVWFNKIDGFHEDISTSIKASTFQGRMVLVLLFMICLIVFDRYVYLKHSSIVLGDALPKNTKQNPNRSWARLSSFKTNETQNISETQKIEHYTKNQENIKMLLKIKLTIHYLLLISVHIVIFWYLPYETQTKDGYQKSNYIKALYILIIIYITFQSLQFKLGLPTFRKYSFPLLKTPNKSSRMIIKVFRLLPFLYEIRTLIDWTFTKTALNLFQWTKLEEIQFRLFFNECTQNSLKYRRAGESIKRREKCVYGIIPLIIVILIIVFPLVIFSTLNPLSYPNKILQASLDVNLIINDRSFSLYSVGSADSINDVDEYLFSKEGFDQSQEMNPDDFYRMKQINMPIGPDLNWEATDLAERRMTKLLKGHLYEGTNTTVTVRLEIHILREYPRKYEKAKIINEKELSRENIETFYNVLQYHSTQEIVVDSLLYTAFRLPSVGTDVNFISYSQDDYTAALNISMFRHDNGRYWKVAYIKDEGSVIGPRFYVISDNYYIGAFNFSVVTFYVSIVYLLARVIRNIFFTYDMNIVMTDTKNYEYLQAMCSMIYVSRMTGNIYEEELFYYELIDVLRSPELIKVITKSSKLKDKLE